MVAKFLKCGKCDCIVVKVKDDGCPVVCCGEEMQELVSGASGASAAKHVPVITVDGNLVHVAIGAEEHVMTDAHYIEFIALETKQGHQLKELRPGDKAEADFALVPGDEVVAAYEYCNLHGLWKSE